MTDNTETNVILFPPMGAGTTPQGMIIPTLTYPHVSELAEHAGPPAVIVFRSRVGDRITSNLPYIIQEVAPAKTIHEA